MEKKVIFTEHAPAPIGPYSQAVWVNGTLYCSGQIAIDPKTGTQILDDVEKEAELVMENIRAVLAAANMDFSNVVKTSIFLKDMNDFSVVNSIYSKYFTADFPARETVEVSRLPKDASVEISVVATLQ